ncbi:hypothetical protein ACFWWA_17205 [Streptomyces goshikiensis]|uniref:hypothetical protein n=1 Tax=Streptomyces goshikiensis TaxID=1942 RepID=UPI00364BC0DC
MPTAVSLVRPPPLLYDLQPPTYTHAHGREPNWRNLMIQYGTRTHLGDPQALADWLA